MFVPFLLGFCIGGLVTTIPFAIITHWRIKHLESRKAEILERLDILIASLE